ncbi:MHYT domain-containing protein [Protofrankia symbiont of Coriaria ruscifolia]|uniref:MHYT domain-containing protein n=1 Tax=Protofrankia symbiont of Coriaria ruscifolia TaxID=1306542 RepID=UPI0010412510|nr:MHYT domain-containing protein [Protofrankia symbiont of Coriaria ruscifolia]
MRSVSAAAEHLHASYDPVFVLLSFLLAVFGSFAALACAVHLRTATGISRLAWMTLTAVALGGCAIWSMHFLGMIAYRIEPGIAFNETITGLSMIIAVIVAGLGLTVVAADPDSIPRLLVGGVIAGAGVVAMHYTGMYAMHTRGTISYVMPLVGLSVLIAVVASTAAFWIAFHIGGTPRRAVASVIMAVAVCGMHYTGMAATRVTADPTLPRPHGVDPFAMGAITTFAASIVLMFIIFAATGGIGSSMPDHPHLAALRAEQPARADRSRADSSPVLHSAVRSHQPAAGAGAGAVQVAIPSFPHSSAADPDEPVLVRHNHRASHRPER